MLKYFYPLVRWFLFKMDAELTHDLTLKWLACIEKSGLSRLIQQPLIEDPVEIFGIRFPNRVGLAAGLDKNARCIDALAELGFGHIEVGTVTPRAQPGNAKPRLFRLPDADALINRFGFNNDGVDKLVENIKSAHFKGVLGVNIGKNFDTSVENALDDYLICMRKVYPLASYITVNISSPNTENLRQLQFGEALDNLLAGIMSEQKNLADKYHKKVPVLIKIAPDLNDEEISMLAKSFKKYKVDGVIATNTTFSRAGVSGLKNAEEQGGLSGAPIFKSSCHVLKKLRGEVGDALPIIGVGGINSGVKAREKLAAGADLIQVYSGLIFRGPELVSEIAESLADFKARK